MKSINKVGGGQTVVGIGPRSTPKTGWGPGRGQDGTRKTPEAMLIYYGWSPRNGSGRQRDFGDALQRKPENHFGEKDDNQWARGKHEVFKKRPSLLKALGGIKKCPMSAQIKPQGRDPSSPQTSLQINAKKKQTAPLRTRNLQKFPCTGIPMFL